jgi:hypothetical protein
VSRIDEDAVRQAGRDVAALALLYTSDAVTVARICDEELDRSGRVLGEVREYVRKKGWHGAYPEPSR